MESGRFELERWENEGGYPSPIETGPGDIASVTPLTRLTAIANARVHVIVRHSSGPNSTKVALEWNREPLSWHASP